MKRNAPSKDADSLGDVADEVFVVVVVVFCFITEWGIRERKNKEECISGEKNYMRKITKSSTNCSQ